MRNRPSKTFLLLTLALTAGCASVQKKTPAPTVVTVGPEATQEAEPRPLPTGPKDRPLTLAFVGDIMMGGSAANKLKTEGPDAFFTATAPLLKQAGVVLGNLEGPLGLSGEVWVQKKYTFLVDPSAAQGLARAGFTALGLANNHSMDFGAPALKSTIEALENAGLAHAGAGMDLSQARQPAWIEKDGWKIALLCYSKTYPTEFWAREGSPGCAPADGFLIREDIQAARQRGADLVFIVCHWGVEKSTKLRGYQESLAHLALEAGADGVLGHHPHIWQGLDVHQGRPIAYSLGNFAFGSLSASTTESGILFLTYDRQRRWSGGWVVPLDVNNYRVDFCPTPMRSAGAGKFFNYLSKLSPSARLSLDGTLIRWAAPVPKEGSLPQESAPNGGLPGSLKP